jgi:hypothetical protein
MPLQIGSRWTDTHGREFVIEDINSNESETWVVYIRVSDRTSYCCLSEAFTHRFSRIENDNRS